MRQRKPNRSQLEKTGSLRIKDAARDIDMRDRVSIEKQAVVLEKIEKRKQRREKGESTNLSGTRIR
jgi:hypothetical protein